MLVSTLVLQSLVQKLLQVSSTSKTTGFGTSLTQNYILDQILVHSSTMNNLLHLLSLDALIYKVMKIKTPSSQVPVFEYIWKVLSVIQQLESTLIIFLNNNIINNNNYNDIALRSYQPPTLEFSNHF